MSDLAIETRGLGKIFRSKRGSVTAVEDLSFVVPAGQIFGLLGPNGAGKTTTVRMLCGLIRPTSGEAIIGGYSVSESPVEVRRRIGMVPEDAGDHKNLTLAEELEYHGALYNLDRATVRQRSEPLVEQLGLGDRVHHPLKTFSRGMRRKFHLIRALIHEPAILLLDEPTAGLDPAVVEDVWTLLRTLVAERGCTVILCSHHLEEVERLCSRVAILRRRLLVQGTLDELSGADRRYRVQLDGPAEQFASVAGTVPGIERAAAEGTVLRVRIAAGHRQAIPQLVRSLAGAGAAIFEVARDGRDLRSLYRSAVENPSSSGEQRA